MRGVTAPRTVDADFLALPRQALADAALSAALHAGASYADLRIHAITTETVQLRDGALENAVVDDEIGLAVRVIVDGTWGFASHAELSPEAAAETARRAVRVATTLAPLNAERIELAPEPVYRDATWVSDYRIDPFDGARRRQDRRARGLLGPAAGRRLASDDHVSAWLHAAKEQTFYADTFGSSITQQRVRVLPTLEAVDRRRGGGDVRDDAHAGPADRRAAGKPSPVTRSGTGPASWRRCPRCWPRRSRRPPSSPGPRIW